MRPNIPWEERIMGAVGEPAGVYSVAALSRSDEEFKLYQSNVAVSAARGLWAMPEPLAVPFHTARIVQDVASGARQTYPFPQRMYTLMGPQVRADGEKLLLTRFEDLDGNGELGPEDLASSEIVTMDLDGVRFTGKGETRLTNNSYIDATPCLVSGRRQWNLEDHPKSVCRNPPTSKVQGKSCLVERLTFGLVCLPLE